MSKRPFEFYETAPWQVDALVDHLPEMKAGDLVWCPTVGDGSIVRQLRERVPGLAFFTNDLDTHRVADHYGDATKIQTWLDMFLACGHMPDWVIDNPPFSLELPIAQHAFVYAQKGSVLMSRLSFVEGTKTGQYPRGGWLRMHPRQLQIALERYSFTGDGHSDSATTEWLVWSKVPLLHAGGHTAFGYKPNNKV
jgi:hypothetical protein